MVLFSRSWFVSVSSIAYLRIKSSNVLTTHKNTAIINNIEDEILTSVEKIYPFFCNNMNTSQTENLNPKKVNVITEIETVDDFERINLIRNGEQWDTNTPGRK